LKDGALKDPEAKVLLLVVDNPAHRVMLTRYLGKTPHHLVYASDGEDGYDRFAEVKPDLVIAHLNVARLDGTILCQLLRQQPRGDSVPVLLIGDESEDERIKKRIQAVGADGYLPVPFSGTVLLDAINPLLATGRQPKLDVILDPPTTPLGLDLKLAPVGGLDFSDRTDGSTTDSMPQASIMESGDLPVPAMPSEHVDLDTVVSFQNPFYEGAPPTASMLKTEAPSATPPDTQDVTEAFVPEPSGNMVKPVVDTDEVLRPSIGASPVPRMESAVLTEATPAEPLPHQGILDEQLISAAGPPTIRDADKKDLSTKSRMLVEPQIGGGNSGSSPGKEPPSKDTSSKSRLIQELPREERTPTGDAAGKNAGAAVRRGLDESQLGKRLAKRVRTMHRLLDEVDYYQLLGVEPGANLQQLKASYFDLSLEFHPDRFFLLRSGDLKEKIYAIYRRIAEAYRVLADEALRRDYDQFRQAKISGLDAIEPKLPPPPIPEVRLVQAQPEDVRARDLAIIAEIAYVEGDLDRARLFLHLARHYEPKKAPIDAALAKVVARLGPTL
jgi:DNA-binding response OmpR family regulator